MTFFRFHFIRVYILKSIILYLSVFRCTLLYYLFYAKCRQYENCVHRHDSFISALLCSGLNVYIVMTRLTLRSMCLSMTLFITSLLTRYCIMYTNVTSHKWSPNTSFRICLNTSTVITSPHTVWIQSCQVRYLKVWPLITCC